MAKKLPEVHMPERKQAAHENVPAETLQTALDVGDEDVMQLKVYEITKLLWIHEDEREEVRHARIIRALELYESLEPVDGAEGMLAMQMVGTHDAALECLKRAALFNQSFAHRDMALKHAHKLMTLYTKQLATLNKHRGKGQQKVTVEHVNVQAGGQAIVGTVEAGATSAKLENPSPKVLEHKDAPGLEPQPAKAKVKAKSRKP